MQQPKKKRTVVRGVTSARVRRANWRQPIDAEALAYALLEIVDCLRDSERAELAAEGQKVLKRIHRTHKAA